MTFDQLQRNDQPPTRLIAQGLQLIKMENDSQQMMAIQNPRDEEKLFKGALKELEMDPEFASKAYYSIPYKDKDTGKTVFVEGPGIGAAMALARRWGNCANSGRIVDERDDYLVVQGVFLDYETNFRTLRDVTVQRKFKKKDGTTYTLAVDRLQMAIQAGISKAARNAILTSLPKALVNAYFKKAKDIAVNGLPGQKQKPVADRLADAKKKFASISVTDEMMKKYYERWKKEAEKPTDEEFLAHLIGVWNGISDEQTSVDEVFGEEKAQAAEAETPKEKPLPPQPSGTKATPPNELFKK